MSGRVVVTGAAGKLGRAVVTDLDEHGWDVVSADRVRQTNVVGQFVGADLTDYGQVLELLNGSVDEHVGAIDAVVNLAALQASGLMPNSATFKNNAVASWNVFNAARAAGVKNVVWASSETVLGLPFDVPPQYVPVDE